LNGLSSMPFAAGFGGFDSGKPGRGLGAYAWRQTLFGALEPQTE
jgi:hypothetical protein